MRDLSRHQEIERFFDVRIVGELHQVLVDDLRARLGGDIGAEVHREIAVGIHVRPLPGHTLAVGDGRAAARQYCELRVHHSVVDDLFLGRGALHHSHQVRTLGGVLEVAIQAVEQHRDSCADNLQMAEFLGGNVHQQVVLSGYDCLQPKA